MTQPGVDGNAFKTSFGGVYYDYLQYFLCKQSREIKYRHANIQKKQLDVKQRTLMMFCKKKIKIKKVNEPKKQQHFFTRGLIN